MPSLPESLEIFSNAWRPYWSNKPRYVMLAQHQADSTLFVAYGTDGQTTFGVRGSWETDLAPFLSLVRADGADIIRMPGYYSWDDTVASVPPSASTPPEFLPQNIIALPPRPTATSFCSPAPSDIEASFDGLFGLSAAA